MRGAVTGSTWTGVKLSLTMRNEALLYWSDTRLLHVTRPRELDGIV